MSNLRTALRIRSALFAPILVLTTCAASGFAANDTNYTYLALGDSVAFGLDLSLFVSNEPPPPPSAFRGYPEFIAEGNHWVKPQKEVNASCPGESSASFITAGAPDYGCYGLGPQGQPPFKTSVGLHVAYSTSQLTYAVSQLSSNKHINLVTLGIGSNDALILLAACNNDSTCVNTKLPGVLAAYAQNLGTILTQIRGAYKGTLVLVKYYSPAPALDSIAIALNTTMQAVGTPFNVEFADGFTAFKIASAPYGGDPCAAGLLVKVNGVCDIHPNAIGQQILAATVEVTLALH